MTLIHWNDVESVRLERGHLAGMWRDLGTAAGSRTIGVQRIEIDAGKWSSPAHVHGAEEEIFYVLGGSGLSWQNGDVFEVRAGDCLVHRPRAEAHTLRAGGDGLDVLAFGQRIRAELGTLPRARAARLGRHWIDLADPERPPWMREVEAGEPEVGEPTERPPRVVNLDELEGEYGGIVKHPGKAAGATQTGLNWIALPAGEDGAPPHCHSAEEELFVILDGDGVLELWAAPDPAVPLQTQPAETYTVRRGHVVSRPAGTRIPHSFRAGPAGMTYLAYGTREPNDLGWYPRSNKVFLRGLGVIARLDLLDYHDGEPS